MNPDLIALIAERKIQEAVEEGAFDNLPCKGQPLVFDDDPMTPAHLRMANKVLKNAGVLPDWMQVQKDLQTERQEIAAHRTRLCAENRKRRKGLENLPASHAGVRDFAAWYAKSRADHLRRIKGVNTLVLKLSIMAPSTVQTPAPLKVEAEMEIFDAEFLPLARQSEIALAPTPAEESSSVLRSAARERYQEGNGGGPVGGWLKAHRMFHRDAREEIAASDDLYHEDIHRSDVPSR